MLGGCATIPTDRPGESKLFIGMVRVKVPNSRGQLFAADVKALGLGWDRGPWLGWKAGNWIVADPARCQLLIVIRTPAQAENAAKVLEALGDQQLCVADYTDSLRH